MPVQVSGGGEGVALGQWDCVGVGGWGGPCWWIARRGGFRCRRGLRFVSLNDRGKVWSNGGFVGRDRG
jgi:hypothetical protein